MQDKLFVIFNKLSIPNFSFKLGNLEFTPSYIQAGMIVALLFLLVLLLARMRREFLHWSLRGATSMIFLGFLMALIIEGFMLIGGRTLITEILGWKNPPKVISKVLDTGREKLVGVLGVKNEIPQSNAMSSTSGDVINLFKNLSSDEADKVREAVCKP